ncbi:hypothetical protein, partial [Escherichia coli]
PQNDVTLKMPAFEWVHVQLHQQKGMISLSPPTICNSAVERILASFGSSKFRPVTGKFWRIRTSRVGCFILLFSALSPIS